MLTPSLPVLLLILHVTIHTAYLNVISSDESFDINGPNVCRRVEPYNVTYIVTETIPYQETKMVWCAQVPPRCNKTTLKYKDVDKVEVFEKRRVVYECCAGFVQHKVSNVCVSLGERYTFVRND
jgi:hypothetical protein